MCFYFVTNRKVLLLRCYIPLFSVQLLCAEYFVHHDKIACSVICIGKHTGSRRMSFYQGLGQKLQIVGVLIIFIWKNAHRKTSCSSLNVFDDGVLDFIHRPYVPQPQRFEVWLFPRHQVNLLWWVRSIELVSIGPPMVEKVQTIDRSKTSCVCNKHFFILQTLQKAYSHTFRGQC
jgi:hypothetical protein